MRLRLRLRRSGFARLFSMSLPVKVSFMPSRLCITVVENNESLCAVTMELLQQHGRRAVGVTSAEALGDEQATALIAVLLVGLNLPGENGFSLMHRYMRQVAQGRLLCSR
jgi:CheY-like chemotaxis protein